MMAIPRISVVISTYERPDLCDRAVASVLAQTDQPLEVLICDDGSSPATLSRLCAWEQRDGRVRYLRFEPRAGYPGPARNLGVAESRGDWVAFLDDDDEWLPDKLARQRVYMSEADVVAGNATGQSGGLYFEGLPALGRLTAREIRRSNPIVFSTAVVRRERLNEIGGFTTAPIKDYVLWLELADRGARFVVLGEPLARYDDCSSGRLSASRAATQVALARLRWKRAATRPAELGRALKQTAVAASTLAAERLA